MGGIDHNDRVAWAGLSEWKPFPKPEIWCPNSFQHFAVGPQMSQLAIEGPEHLYLWNGQGSFRGPKMKYSLSPFPFLKFFESVFPFAVSTMHVTAVSLQGEQCFPPLSGGHMTEVWELSEWLTRWPLGRLVMLSFSPHEPRAVTLPMVLLLHCYLDHVPIWACFLYTPLDLF